MTRTRIFTPLFTAAALAACASSPESIAPVSMTGAYQHLSCRQAASMLAGERTRLASLESAQRSVVTGDAVGVFLIGVPVSSLAGNDREGDIATAKGKVLALEQRLGAC